MVDTDLMYLLHSHRYTYIKSECLCFLWCAVVDYRERSVDADCASYSFLLDFTRCFELSCHVILFYTLLCHLSLVSNLLISFLLFTFHPCSFLLQSFPICSFLFLSPTIVTEIYRLQREVTFLKKKLGLQVYLFILFFLRSNNS